MRHALDADHIAAVAALATNSYSLRDTVKVATVWGTGHAITLMLVVSCMIMLDATLPSSLDNLFELAVGLISILLGIGVLRRARSRGVHLHAHEHSDGEHHFHVHAHDPSALEHDAASHRHTHVPGMLPRALLVGGVHGMAGSAVLLLVWLRTLPSGASVLAYVAVFALGTILGMVLFSLVIAVPLRGAAQLPRWVARGVDVAVGVVAVVVGLQIVARLMALAT
jgi:ABC-type nickel/cobalt efflux system permease component RcnA